MRERPQSFKSIPAAHWICAAVDRLLGERDLANVPALMSGFGVVLDHPRAQAFAPAAFALRHLGVDAASEIMLRQVVHDALLWEETHREEDDFVEPPYEIDLEDPRYSFRLRDGFDHLVGEMVETLTGGLPFRRHGRDYADSSRPMAVVAGTAEAEERITVDLSGIDDPPRPPRHDFERRPRGAIEVPLAELEAIAEEMDARDRLDPERPRGNWASRLREATGERKFHVLVPNRAEGALRETEVIRLDGLKHLIGLPGTGKTTLIVLLLVWLDRADYRTVVLLPSIEASLNLLGDLRFYEADVGLLVGQSPQTRIDHARKLAERIGTDETRGFGKSAPGADLMSLNCALGAFDTDPQGEGEFPHLMPPCTNLRQRKLKKDGEPGKLEGERLCPLAGWCGRLKAPRELTGHRIWLGHVLSTDTKIGPHFSDWEIRYYEAIAMTADLVIVDEADGAQATLDAKAIASLDLTGSVESYEHKLMSDLFVPFSAGRNYNTATNVQQYITAASDFSRLNHNLVVLLQHIHRDTPGANPLDRFKDTFVTGNNVISALFCPDEVFSLPPEERVKEERRFNAIRTYWDACAEAAMFRRSDDDEDIEAYAFNPERVASALESDRDRLEKTALRITRFLRKWLAEPLPSKKGSILIELRQVVFELVSPKEELGPGERAVLFNFLVGATTVIMQFQTLIRAQQAMTAEGIHHEPPFRGGISKELGQVVPESLIGRLSGIRYHLNQTTARPSITLQYVSFRGAPRLLLYRLHELLRHDSLNQGRGGPNVLLASATSFLEESPTFHIPVGPDLILRHASETDGWADSEYHFAPIPDPENPTRYLRYSGAPLAKRDYILRKMIDHYFRGAAPLAVAMTQDFDPGRKVAFVVNSYDQVRLFKDHLRRTSPALAARVIGVTNRPPSGNEGDWITAAQVERLGSRPDDWDVLVFPMKALSRGVNIVFENGDRRRDALLGTVVFLTRPHPAIESLDLVAGLAGSSALGFDQFVLPEGATVSDMTEAWRAARGDLMQTTRRLLRYPLQASRLGPLARPFTGDIMVDVLQTIGRAMRNGCKARVVFADSAWAPNSVHPDPLRREGRTSSMIVLMRDILRQRMNDPDPVNREIYHALYDPFLHPLETCRGVRFPDGETASDE